MAHDAQAIADRYIACWNERDETRRRTLLDGLWMEDATYADPLMRSEGRAGIGELIEGVQARFPDLRFAAKGRADGHGDRVRFSWSLGPVGGEGVVEGTDFAVVSPDGRLRDVTGFLDRVPPQA